MNKGEVDVAPIRQAVLKQINRGSLSWGAICNSLGWIANKKADTSRLQRRLGLRATCSHGHNIYTTGIRYDTAVNIVKAIGYDPVDWDL